LSDVGIYPKVINKAKPKAFLVLGNSGSGKGTQSKKIAEKFGFHNIATGDLLRAEMKQNGRHKEIIEESMRLGKLVPTEIVVKLMKQEIEKKNWEGVFLIDGFPRNKDNLIKWNEEIGVEVELVNMFLLNCS
jgi:adenylate kinase family enzyme